MTIAIVVLMLLAYLLIATEHVTHINKATTAMFAGVVGWILYIIYVGPDKAEIAEHVFVRHSAYFCSIVLYLLSTMAIVEVLSDNGCFDFITNFLRTRSMPRFLWGTVLITFLLSANLDNLTTVVLMLIIVRRLLASRRQRLYVGAAVVVAACCGGSFTVIGDVTTLMLWTRGAVTPTAFAQAMTLPALVATFIPVLLISYELPDTLDINRRHFVFLGDDSAMPLWQRCVMLFFGIVGLCPRSIGSPSCLPSSVRCVCWALSGCSTRCSTAAASAVTNPSSCPAVTAVFSTRSCRSSCSS